MPLIPGPGLINSWFGIAPAGSYRRLLVIRVDDVEVRRLQPNMSPVARFHEGVESARNKQGPLYRILGATGNEHLLNV